MNGISFTLPDICRLVATKLHEGQYRSYTGEPYIFHPLRVEHMVNQSDSEFKEYQSCVALLHDVVEDSKYFDKAETLEEKIKLLVDLLIEAADLFGKDTRKGYDLYHDLHLICEDVEALTMPSTFNASGEKNRAERKKEDIEYARRHFDFDTCIIKLFDIYDNYVSIAQHDEGFARVWLRESLDLTEVFPDIVPNITEYPTYKTLSGIEGPLYDIVRYALTKKLERITE